jgi:large subunit ribosomal protein L29
MTQRIVAVDNLRDMSADELAAHLREQRGQLFQVRLQQTIGQVENHRQIRAIRKEIARTMTVQVQARLAAERGDGAGVRVTPAPAAETPVVKRRRLGRPRPAAAPVDAVVAEEQEVEEVPVSATDIDEELAAPVVGEAEADDEIDSELVRTDETDGAERAPATDEDEQ